MSASKRKYTGNDDENTNLIAKTLKARQTAAIQAHQVSHDITTSGSVSQADIKLNNCIFS